MTGKPKMGARWPNGAEAQRQDIYEAGAAGREAATEARTRAEYAAALAVKAGVNSRNPLLVEQIARDIETLANQIRADAATAGALFADIQRLATMARVGPEPTGR